jgi:hypothetical protein
MMKAREGSEVQISAAPARLPTASINLPAKIHERRVR